MNEQHYKEKLSEFVNHELTHDERQKIGEHLFLCAECRAEHDEIKFGAHLAAQLKQTDAPAKLWNKIENSLDEKAEKVTPFSRFALVGSPVFAAGFLIVFGLITTTVYFGIWKNDSTENVKNESQKMNVETPQTVSTPNETINQNKNQTSSESTTIQPILKNETQNKPQIADSNIKNSPKNPPDLPKENLRIQKNPPSWEVEALAGTPKIGDSFETEKLAVGEFLETDKGSRARVQVADIGNVEIAPNSRVKLVKTKSTEHRLALEKGELHAKIFAPPRLFIVDTPSAVAVDLGCEYTLEVDEKGNSRLHVTGGFVALENGKVSSIVPAGAVALTKKGIGIGTPFAESSTAELQNALYKFDFENGGNEALEIILRESDLYDSLTLWHLLPKTKKADREKVFDTLKNKIALPANITREGVLKLNKKMLDAWWQEIENVWFE